MAEAKQQTFTKASELKTAPRFHRSEIQETCAMCDGREPAMPIGEKCIDVMIENAIERLIDQGRFDGQLQNVLDRRLARASIPPAEPQDHGLVDQVSGIIRD